MHAILIALDTIIRLIASTPLNIEEVLPVRRCWADMQFIEICIQNSINSMKTQLSSGIPELNIPPFDRYPIYHHEVTVTKVFKGTITFKDMLIYELNTYDIEYVRVNANISKIHFIAYFPRIKALSDYKINGTIGNITIEKQGRMVGILHNAITVITIDGAYYTNYENGNSFFRVNTVRLDLKYGDIFVDFDNLNDLLRGKYYIQYFPGHNWKIIFPELGPHLELMAADFIKTTANKIYSKFPMNMLIPR